MLCRHTAQEQLVLHLRPEKCPGLAELSPEGVFQEETQQLPFHGLAVVSAALLHWGGRGGLREELPGRTQGNLGSHVQRRKLLPATAPAAECGLRKRCRRLLACHLVEPGDGHHHPSKPHVLLPQVLGIRAQQGRALGCSLLLRPAPVGPGPNVAPTHQSVSGGTVTGMQSHSPVGESSSCGLGGDAGLWCSVPSRGARAKASEWPFLLKQLESGLSS